MTEPHSPSTGLWRDVWYAFAQHRGALLGAVVFGLILLTVYLGPFLWTLDPGFADIRVACRIYWGQAAGFNSFSMCEKLPI